MKLGVTGDYGLAFDPDYDYDDPDQQRRRRIRPGVTKEYMNDTTYYLKFTDWAKRDKDGEGSKDYQK